MHQHQGGAGFRRDLRQRRVVLQAAHIVDQRGAGTQRRARDRGLVGVDGDRDAQASGESLEHRQHAGEFVGGGQRFGSGTGRLAADVNQIGAPRLHL